MKAERLAVESASTHQHLMPTKDGRKTKRDMRQKVFIEIDGIDNIEDFRNELTVMLGCYEDMSGEHEIKFHVDADYSATAWEICQDDLEKYDLEGLTEEEIHNLIDEIANDMGDNECVCEDFIVIRDEIMERNCIPCKSWENLTEKLKASDMCRKVFDKSSQTEYTFDAAIEEVVALWQCSQTSYPEEYYGKEQMWAEELADVLANKE